MQLDGEPGCDLPLWLRFPYLNAYCYLFLGEIVRIIVDKSLTECPN